jgi:catalase
MANTVKKGVQTRKVAILAADGVDGAALSTMQRALKAAGAQFKIIAPRLGTLATAQGNDLTIDWSFLTAGSVLFDAVYVPGGEKSATILVAEPRAVEFVGEAYKHCKAIAASGAAGEFVNASCLEGNSNAKAKGDKPPTDSGVITGPDAQPGKIAAVFIKAIAQHRHWSREMKDLGLE